MNFNLDSAKLFDSAFAQNPDGSMDFLTKKHQTKMIGELVFEDLDLNGNVLFTSEPEYNDIIITGSTMVLEKMFGVKANLTISTLSQDMGINAAVAPNASNLTTENIVGFMVGVGGAGETVGDVNSVAYTQKSVSSIVPFRVNAVALTGAEAAQYFMTKNIAGSNYYYCKRFDNTAQVRHIFSDGSEVPANISETGTTRGIQCYGEVVCVISNADIREYFLMNDGNIDKCRINTLGLVSAYPAGADMGGVRLVTAINFKSRYLTNNDDSIRITYRVYCL
jgi:hypothetical protein